ncbi:hypothetical protein BU25DRAFT_252078 [Macroventuria anomochaeta]|uniref:Uncharacterized protein n=1 Tax=Macroventuria anomochaeta TaxID=301207 RepID=A0ACB6SCD5_9PLEO|nr:uncharacterized protein BU25DRAFT_252078 [Macroventuria anomochaeta]KAF2630909.1 hypothetical protein BU25DRAFT_252078 [Macroventuria anomochaeta]
MQTRARAGKLQKPSQLLQSSETLARDPLAKNIVISDNSAQRRPGIYDLGPNSTDGIPPPPLPSRRTRKATSNVESTEPVEPARQRKGKSAAPRRQLKASAPQLPPTDLLSRQNLKTVEHQASPDPGQAMQAPSNLDTIEVASSPSPLQASTDLQGPTRQSGSPKPSNVEPAEIPRGSTNQRVNVANSEQIGLIRGLVREVATLDAPILERIEVCSSTSPSALSVDHEPSGPGSPLAAGAAPLDRENLDNIENLRQSASFTAAAAAEENEICAAPESLSAGDFSKDVENDEVQKPPPRKRRTKQRTTVTYPRRPLPEPAASQLRAIWQQRWGEKPNIVTSEDKLR